VRLDDIEKCEQVLGIDSYEHLRRLFVQAV
jgi:hypothetical protein